MRRLLRLLSIVVLALLGLSAIWFWDGEPPRLEWDGSERLGKNSTLNLKVRDEEKGLRRVRVLVRQSGREFSVGQTFDLSWFPWQQSRSEIQIPILPNPEISLEEGPFEVEVSAVDQSNLWLFSREAAATERFVWDQTPPRVEVVTSQHYLRQGGAESILYRLSEENCSSGVLVGDREFQGYPVPELGQGYHFALFALAHDDSPDSKVFAWAEDEAGNRVQTGVWCKIFPQDFRSRRIEVSESFIASTAPEILSHSDSISEQATPVETFVEINSRLRQLNNQAIEALSRNSAPRLLWSEPFLQLSNSQVESFFADRRTYLAGGKEIDRQTHLGFDLASTRKSPVEAANDGVVAFAEYLGIYGNCILIDHGMGLFSLYGHLSRIDVSQGDPVSRGQVLGVTGTTGLAAGDHLHFSMVLQGVQVNPIEWWDEDWVRLHVLSRLQMDR